MSTWSRFAAAAALALAVLGPGAAHAQAGYFPPGPVIARGYGYSSYAYYNVNPLAFNPIYTAPQLYFRPSTAGPIYGLPANYPTPSFGAYGIFSTYTFGPPYTFVSPGDVSYYPYGTTATMLTTTVVAPYNYEGPYVGPALYRP